jgi:hypothetical protein
MLRPTPAAADGERRSDENAGDSAEESDSHCLSRGSTPRESM